MVLVVKDRIKDTSTTSGTGTITLANSPPAGYQAFSTLGNGSTTYYAIQDANDAFEIGLGTYNANTLTRTTILSSSNSGNLVNLTSGPNTVWVDYPAAKAYLSEEGIDKSFTATASITAGKPVILNSAGTVTQVAEIPATIAAGLGTKTTTELASSIYDQQAAMGINGQFVSVYRQGNDYMCQVNTISATDLKTITHGTSQLTFNLSSSTDVGIIYQPDADKYVLFYKDSSSYLTGSVMTVSGTGASATLTTATAVTLRSTAMNGSPNNSNLTYDTSSDLLIACWTEGSSPKTVSMPISGTTISANTVESVPKYGSYVNSYSCRCAYSSTANKVVYLYSDNDTEDLYTTVGTVSGSSFTFGSTAIVGSLPTGNYNGADACVGVDNNGVVVLSYLAQDITPSYTLFSQAGTLSGTTITWGSPSQVSNVTCYNNASNECSIAPIASGKMIIARATRSDSPSNADKGIFAIVTSSGTTVSNGSVQIYSSTASRYPSLAVNYSKTQAVINWGDSASMDMNNIVYLESQQTGGGVTNLTTSNYLGVASTSAGANASVNINIPGSINNDQTGLTIGKNYYTSGAGVISTTLSSNFVGKAISSTQLLLGEEKGNSLDGFSNGAITKGKPVVMQADGDVAQAGQVNVTNTGTASQGSLGNIGTYQEDMFAMAVASDGVTYCFTYQTTSNGQACKIGTRSGETISWGSELVLASVTSVSHFVSYDASANVFVTSYTTGNLLKGTAVSFSGNTGTKGTEVTIMDLGNASGNPSYHYQHWYDSTNEITVCWARGGVSGNNTNRSSAVALTLTGTSISVGTLYENTTAGGQYNKGCDITGGKHVVYWRSNSSYYPNVMTMTVTSSGAISWGTPLVINSATGSFSNPVYNPIYPNKVILAGKISTANNYLSYAGLTISGTSITASNFSDGNINNAQSYVESGGNVAVYSNYSGNYCFVYQTYSPYNSRYNFATTTDGLSLTVATAVTTTGHGSNQFYAGACASDVDGVVVENHNDRSSSPGYYSYYCFNPTFNYTSLGPTNLTATNYLGIASDTVANNENATIQTQGAVNPDQSSLTAGQLYYVQTDGTLSTTAGSPSVIAGIATSATTLLVTKS
jgi:hypothetical protein